MGEDSRNAEGDTMKKLAIITISYLSSGTFGIEKNICVADDPKKFLIDVISKDGGVYGIANEMSIRTINIDYALYEELK